MILVDANLLLYAKFLDLPQHPKARIWLEKQMTSRGKVGIPWESCLAFLRLSTNPRLFGSPLTVVESWNQIEEWLSHPRTWIPQAGPEHPIILGELLQVTQAAGNLVPDAHLAALAIQHGLVLCSADSDFARFPGLKWENPVSS